MGDKGGAWVALRDVSRAYRQGRSLFYALDGVTLDVEPGQTVALTGSSGSGKTTLLRMIGGIERPDEGRIVVDGTHVHSLSWRRAPKYRRGIGFVFQHYRLLLHLPATENVLVPLMGGRIGKRERAWAADLLAAVGLDAQQSLPAGRLSGGEQQRVAIARALVSRPGLLLADEPTGALDSRTGEQVLDLLSGLHAELGFTLLLATHDAAVAAQCERQVRMMDGRIVGDRATPSLDHEELLRRVTGLGRL